MSHDGRVWLVGDINGEVNDFLSPDKNNVTGFDPYNDFLIDVKVRIDGRFVGKNLIRLPSRDAINTFKENQKKLRLRFRIYIQDSPGAIIVPWIGDPAFSPKKETEKGCKKTHKKKCNKKHKK